MTHTLTIERFSGSPNPEMVIMARLAHGFTQAEMAKAIKSSPAGISRIEDGGRVASSDEIRAMSELTGYPVGFFHQEGRMVSIRHLLIHRKASGCIA